MYKPYAQGGIKSGNQNPLSTRRKSGTEQPEEAVMLMVMDDKSVDMNKGEQVISQGATIDDDVSPNR